jgi:hypothetical protein
MISWFFFLKLLIAEDGEKPNAEETENAAQTVTVRGVIFNLLSATSA